MSIYLGIDIGTSGTKTLAIDDRGKILAQAMATYPCYHPKPLWSEQDPDDWWQATVKTVRAVVKQGQAEAGRRQGDRPLRPDARLGVPRQEQPGRSAAHSSGTTSGPPPSAPRSNSRAGGRSKLIQMVANPALTGFTAPKILWLRNNEPKNFDKTREGAAAEGRNPPPPDRRVRHRSQRRQRHAAARRRQAPLVEGAALASWNSTRACSRKCYESEEVTGKLTADAAKLLGLSTDCVVVGGAGDCAAGAVGNGIVRQGVLSTSIGTSGVMFVHSDTPQVDPAGPAPHVLPRRPRQVAHDGRHPLRRRLAAMVPQRTSAKRVAAEAKKTQDRRLRRAHRRGRRHAARRRRPVLPALPLRRAHAARRSRTPAAASSA